MNLIVAVDPGLIVTGVAVGTREELLRAGYVEHHSDPRDAGLAARCARMGASVLRWVRLAWRGTAIDGRLELVVEWPRVLAATHQKGAKRGADPNDLLAVAGVAAAVAMALDDVVEATSEVHPDVWKGGQVPKDVMGRRVLARLTAEERERLDRRPEGGFDHNMLDAVGVYLHHVGRLDRRRVLRAR